MTLFSNLENCHKLDTDWITAVIKTHYKLNLQNLFLQTTLPHLLNYTDMIFVLCDTPPLYPSFSLSPFVFISHSTHTILLLRLSSLRGQQQQPWVSSRPGRRCGEGEEDSCSSGCRLHSHHTLSAGTSGHTRLLEVHTHARSILCLNQVHLCSSLRFWFVCVTETVSRQLISTQMTARHLKSFQLHLHHCCWPQVTHTHTH